MNRRGITHIAPDEAQGHSRSPDFSSDHVASGFRWGIKQLDADGVMTVPNHSNDVCAGGGHWGQGFQKP